MLIKKLIVKTFKLSLVSMSFFTMTFSELARAKENEKFSKAQVAAAIQELGLNKDQTFGEFYNKNKNLFPKHVQAEIEPFLKTSSQMKMPKFSVSSARANSGEMVSTVSTDVDGKLVNIQFLGSDDKYIKFQNTNLSKTDVINFKDMMAKIWYGDETIRKTGLPYMSSSVSRASKQKSMKSFKGLPAINYAAWMKLSREQRASYIVQMRLMYLDAVRVNMAFAKKGKKTVDFPILEKLIEEILGAEAEAQSRRRPQTTGSQMTVSDPRYEGSCVVAGYIGNYASGLQNSNSKNTRGCSVDVAIQNNNSDYIKKANATCRQSNAGSVACNPILYGYEITGSPLCVNKVDAEFQQATHWEGPCDSRSRLSSDAVKEKINFDNAPYNTSEDEHNRQKKAVLDDPQSVTETKRFLQSVLSADGKGELAKLLTGNGLTKENFESLKTELNAIGARFNEEIKKAIGSCEAQVNNAAKSVPQEQRLACDQLHRRYLNIQGVIDSLHLPEQVTPTPGPTPNPPGPRPEPTPPQVGDCDSMYPGAGTQVGASGKCVCPVGTSGPTKVGVGPNDEESWECGGGGKPGKPGGDSDCGFMCKLWGGIKKLLPFGLAALGIYAMYRVMMPKKPALNPAGDRCPDGSTANPTCNSPCGIYQVPLTGGGCGCPTACAPGQTITDQSTCTCGSTGGGGTTPTQYTCADGVTKVPDLSQCPAAQFTCWDGSKVPNAISCPVKNNATPSTGTGIDKNGTGR